MREAHFLLPAPPALENIQKLRWRARRHGTPSGAPPLVGIVWAPARGAIA
jgi:hypothetical protein